MAGSGGNERSVAQFYNADMTPASAAIDLATYADGSRNLADIAVLDNGGLAVTWTSNGDRDGDGQGILAQRFDAAGTALGAAFQVNETVFNTQYQPTVTAQPGGGFVITWDSFDADGSSFGVVAKTYGADGEPVANRQVPGAPIWLELVVSDLQFGDIDGSERLRELRFAGLPASATMNMGGRDADGDWVVSTNERTSLFSFDIATLTLPTTLLCLRGENLLRMRPSVFPTHCHQFKPLVDMRLLDCLAPTRPAAHFGIPSFDPRPPCPHRGKSETIEAMNVGRDIKIGE